MTDERGGRYFREARFFLAGDKVVAQSHILEARSLMGYMRDQRTMGGPPVQVQYATLKDGTQIKATMMNGQYQAEIISPLVQQPQKPRKQSVVFVRPFPPTMTEDWRVTFTEAPGLCELDAVLEPRRLFSNRNWVSADGEDIVSILGGTDWDRYYPKSYGSTIVVNGETVSSPGTGAIWGAALYGGRLVVVRATDVTSFSPTNGSILTFRVYVDGVLKHTSNPIDSRTYTGNTGSGGTTEQVFANSWIQKTIVFNASGSVGVSCITPFRHVRITLTTDGLGDTVVGFDLLATPGTTPTYSRTSSVSRHGTSFVNQPQTHCGPPSFRVQTDITQGKQYDENSQSAPEVWTTAIAADFVFGSDELRFLMYTYADTGTATTATMTYSATGRSQGCDPATNYCSWTSAETSYRGSSRHQKFWWSDTGAAALELIQSNNTQGSYSAAGGLTGSYNCVLTVASGSTTQTGDGYSTLRLHAVDVRFGAGLLQTHYSGVVNITQTVTGNYGYFNSSFSENRLFAFGSGPAPLVVWDEIVTPMTGGLNQSGSLTPYYPGDMSEDTTNTVSVNAEHAHGYIPTLIAQYTGWETTNYTLCAPGGPTTVFVHITDSASNVIREVHMLCPESGKRDVTSSFPVTGDITTTHFGLAKV